MSNVSWVRHFDYRRGVDIDRIDVRLDILVKPIHQNFQEITLVIPFRNVDRINISEVRYIPSLLLAKREFEILCEASEVARLSVKGQEQRIFIVVEI